MVDVHQVLTLLDELMSKTGASATRATCIEQCGLFREVLRRLDIPVREIVTRVIFHVPGRQHACLLGFSDAERRAAKAQHAAPMNGGERGFQGHLVLIVAGQFLFDPSLCQVKYADGSYIMRREFIVLDTKAPILRKFPTFELHLTAQLDDGNSAEIIWTRKNNDGYKKSRAWEMDKTTQEVAGLLEREIRSRLAGARREGRDA